MSIDIYIMIFFMIIILLCILCKNPIITKIQELIMYSCISLIQEPMLIVTDSLYLIIR